MSLSSIATLTGRIRREHSSAIFYTTSALSKTACQFLASLVVVRLVAPADMGLWSGVSLATTYAALLQAGVNNGLSRELPHYLGRGDTARAMRLAGTAQTFTLGACLGALVTGVAALLWFRGQGPVILLAISAETVVVFYTLYQGYLSVTFRSKNSFWELGKAEFLNALLGLLLLALVFFFRFEGMLVRAIVVSLTAIALLHTVRPIKVGLLWDAWAIKELLKTGFPIFVLFYVESSCATLDRVFLLRRAGVEQLGYYSLGLMAQQAMLVVPLSLATYMYPRMTFALAKDNDLGALWGRAWKSTVALLAIMAPVSAVAALAIRWLVPSLFPKYVPGIPAAQVLAIAALFSGSAVGVNALWSMKAWKYMAAYQLSGASLKVIGPYLGIRLHQNPLSGVAWGVLGAFVSQLVLSLVLTHHATHRGASRYRQAESAGGDA